MSQIIMLDDVSHHFKINNQTISLFNKLNLKISAHHSHAIMGPSGVGKSSLLLILAGLEKPVSGKMTFTDRDCIKTELALRQCSGFVFQQFHLLPELDALNNIALPLKLKGDKHAIEKALFWLKQVGLEYRSKHKPNELSGGEQQRVAIARAFVTQPSFVFADEPTGNLDTQTAKEIADLMFSCAKINKTGFVVVTHSKDVCDRADFCYEMSHGKINKVNVQHNLKQGSVV
ncbi:ABC transporter ATP-binding protein [Pseudoalteromonas denitrificans]|uniref:Putative ABC transport system ATP-binding protein n=1 Tax=Pseudoalteromonas denitrificans DSM 6059 TaxID=1123010 RepID=A0A1I1N3P8_9GAMM|nr:ABC transporter ATP-binding protein [Pseudoalteromonas denitrificans]SFC91986.1 putative ABC transport system ATP-binding protein [Pseudoalteromonas denitrificans DSM 6059]